MIQVITGNTKSNGMLMKLKESNEYKLSEFKDPKVFDDFELNILDLSFAELWEYEDSDIKDINMNNDIKHYYRMIEDNVNTKILIILPQNISFKYDRGYSSGYMHYRKYENLKI